MNLADFLEDTLRNAPVANCAPGQHEFDEDGFCTVTGCSYLHEQAETFYEMFGEDGGGYDAL